MPSFPMMETKECHPPHDGNKGMPSSPMKETKECHPSHDGNKGMSSSHDGNKGMPSFPMMETKECHPPPPPRSNGMYKGVKHPSDASKEDEAAWNRYRTQAGDLILQRE